MENESKKVIVAMSGGVDSSVSAALLKRTGFDVVGVFMKLTNTENLKESENRARKIAKILKIPFFVFDLRKEFKNKIIQYFIKEYMLGNTPNPCVVCNKEIKFKFLTEKAKELKADFIATGHYAKIKKSNNLYKIIRPKDEKKDQTYFLWKLSQEEIKKIIFPVEDYKKDEIKLISDNFKLYLSKIPESQEACFIKDDLVNFLKKYIKPKPGKIIDKNGTILGKHKGLIFYTIGQRKGIGLAGGPYFVFLKDQKKNNLIVTKNEKDLYKKETKIKDVNWVAEKVKMPTNVLAQIRYRHKPTRAKIYQVKEDIRVVFNKPQKSVTSGQSLVFYKGNELLGGGIIV